MSIKAYFDRHVTFFNITAWLMAAFFGVLSIYFYRATLKYGEISYIASKTKIFDARISTPDIVVTRGEGGPQIKTDVYASEVIFWNSGNLRADGDGTKPDKPLTIVLDGSGEIVGTVVQGWNRPDLTTYTLTTSENRREVAIEWTKFRPGFGLRLTVLHTGVPTSNVRATADIFEFNIVDRSSTLRSDEARVSIFGKSVASSVISAIFSLIISLSIFCWFFVALLTKSKEERDRTFVGVLMKSYFMIGMIFMMFVSGILLVYLEFFGRPIPPV